MVFKYAQTFVYSKVIIFYTIQKIITIFSDFFEVTCIQINRYINHAIT